MRVFVCLFVFWEEALMKRNINMNSKAGCAGRPQEDLVPGTAHTASKLDPDLPHHSVPPLPGAM